MRQTTARLLTAAVALATLAGEAGTCAAATPAFIHEARLAGRLDPIGRAGGLAGASVAISGDTAVVGAPGGWSARLNGDVYVFVRTGGAWVLQQRLVGPVRDPNHFALFGHSVAISGDTIVVGEPWDGSSVFSSGAAHVFARSAGVWSYQQTLLAPDARTDDFFGGSVSVSGGTVVVAASRRANGSLANAGAAYVFTRGGSGWNLQQVLTPSDAAASDFFGSAVSLDGDSVAVGAYAAVRGGIQTGVSYVFARAGATWSEQQRLVGTLGQEAFGQSLCLSGSDLIVGAPSFGGGRGSATVYVRSGATWSTQALLTAADGGTGDQFGWSVALYGETAAVGAMRDDTAAGVDSGSVYTFSRTGTYWLQRQRMLAADGAANDRLGSSLALSDVALLAGAEAKDAGGPVDSGAAYAFGLVGSVWLQQQELVGGDDASDDHFGYALSLDGSTLAVGAPEDDTAAGIEGGSVYVLLRSGAAWTEQQKISVADPGGLGSFGRSVAVSGDTLVVGAPDHQNRSGAAYVFVRVGATWVLQQKLVPATVTPNGAFGTSVAVSGNTAVIGAFNSNQVSGDPGAAFVFVRSGSAWTQQQQLFASEVGPGDAFGTAVAVDGDTALVGARWVGEEAGAAYLFTRSGSSWGAPLRLTPPDVASYDWYGSSVALSNGTALVGSQFDRAGRGAACVFVGSGSSWALQETLAPLDLGWTAGFGGSVDVSGDLAVVGAAGEGGVGAAFLFSRSGSQWSAGQRVLPPDGDAWGVFGYAVAAASSFAAVGDFRQGSAAGPGTGAVDVFAPGFADLGVTKTDGAAQAAAGGLLTYTIVVSNAGPHAVTDARVQDAPPAGLSCSALCTGTGGASCGKGLLQGAIDDWVSVPAGQSVSYRSACSVSTTAAGSLTNTVHVSTPAEITDLDPLNDTATDVDVVLPGLSITGSSAHEGDGALQFTIALAGEITAPVTVDYATQDRSAAAGSDYTAVSGQVRFETSPASTQITVPVLPDAVPETTESFAMVLSGATNALAWQPTALGTIREAGAQGFFTVPPCRIIDTRVSTLRPAAPLEAATTTRFPVAGLCGVPLGARAVAANVTITQPSEPGHLTAFAAGSPLPRTSTLNYRPGQTRANNAVIPLDSAGELALNVGQVGGTVHVVVDVSGYVQ